ncbi:4'-phosphopantetheinyl transferase superfamily protein [Microaerobacter geothermalis]|uniref:4'-phosphopantetheinyl transferase family protein n=1 Tax=Microaerobacter geothermalis TaxID=674972 RepID=UPI001F192B06|nr:4'-phosphopantetheinyl transferase superfamily protein [Microaerobacter geothermalis]MCF6094294.1 4'-phosphopantetheinyl transferase superfamily protein [Microaerobacter geothermalis]
MGVDIEQIRPIDMEIANRFFTQEEREVLFHLPGNDQLSFFYELWTLKESFVKAIGQGLSCPLDSFGFDMRNYPHTITLLDIKGRDKMEWHFKKYFLNKDYCVAICANFRYVPDNARVLNRDLFLL